MNQTMQQNSLEKRFEPLQEKITMTLDLAGLIRIVVRRRWLVIALTFAGIAISVALIMVSTRRYMASAQLQVLNRESDLSASRLSGNAEDAADPLDFNLTLQTYVDVLNSDTLALRVIDELNLQKTNDYYYAPTALPWNRRNIVTTMADREAAAADQRVWLLKRFHKNLTVNAVPGTRVLKVDFSGTNPELTAVILNQLLQDFEAYNFQVHYDATLGPSNVLGKELERLRNQVRTAENKVGELQRKTGNFGSTDNYNVVLSRLEALNKAALDAENNRVLKQAVYSVTSTGDPELISTLSGSGIGSSVQGGGLTLIQSLRQQQAELQATNAQLSARYGENYPKLAEMKQQLDSLNASINREVRKIGDRAKNDFLIAKQQEDSTKSALDKQRVLAGAANDSTIQFLMAKGEADADRQLYLTLSEKLRQVQLVSGLHASNISVIDPARTPASAASPKIPLMLASGLFGGLFLGFGWAFAAEAKDTRLRNVEEAEVISGLPLLGMIPRIPTQRIKPSQAALGSQTLSRNIAVMLSSTIGISFVAESYRAIRTSLLFSRVSGSSCQVCMITSAMRSDGKSTTAINIATVFAQMGFRTLIIDADLRDGSIAGKLELRVENGLAEALVSGFNTQTIQSVDAIEHLDVISAGRKPVNPSELLSSASLSDLLVGLRSQYEYIFVDSPPCIAVTDAVAMARHVDNFILVVRPGLTTRPALAQSVLRTRHAGAPCLGILVNAVDPSSSEYIDYGGYGVSVANTLPHEAAS